MQLPGIEHSGSGSRGASADRNRLVRNDLTNSQHAPFGTIETACHFLLTAIVDFRPLIAENSIYSSYPIEKLMILKRVPGGAMTVRLARASLGLVSPIGSGEKERYAQLAGIGPQRTLALYHEAPRQQGVRS